MDGVLPGGSNLSWVKTVEQGKLPDGFFLVRETSANADLAKTLKSYRLGFVMVRRLDSEWILFTCPLSATEPIRKEALDLCKKAKLAP
jgi:hypothetical protein